jgi:hypothetical protein
MVTSYNGGLTTVSMGQKFRVPQRTSFCSGCCDSGSRESMSVLIKRSTNMQIIQVVDYAKLSRNFIVHELLQKCRH